MTIEESKRDLARRTRRGISNILAGVLLWTLFAVLGILLPPSPEKALIYLFGAGLLLPMGLGLGALLRFDMFAKGNPLTQLAGLLGGLQILFIPLMIGAYYASPQMVPWYLAVLVGAHFLPFSWLYESRGYWFAAVATSVGGGLSGWLFPEQAFVMTPLLVAGVLAITAVLLLQEIKSDRHLALAEPAQFSIH